MVVEFRGIQLKQRIAGHNELTCIGSLRAGLIEKELTWELMQGQGCG